ncbi:hypothetical protein DL769_006369 [Monosporascus sp. CRB-8-3]|nr:hypothetical protein DL769_006369 [Monosporascus sp. CRB-8-3]
MTTAQETTLLLEEGNHIGPGPLGDLEVLDLNLESILASGDVAKIRDIEHSHHTDRSISRGTPRTESEIVVRFDDMDVDMESTTSAQVSQNHILASQDNVRNSFESPASALSDQSELTSPPSSPPQSSKATTPTEPEALKTQVTASAAANTTKIPSPSMSGRRRIFDVRPRISIPTDIAPHEYAHQCIAAAESSRLNPYALHQDEYLMLREHISHAQVTTYLNIRNGILRLWLNNPRIGVSREEAVGCAKDARWFDVASVCYDWLLRSGYINFGCAEVPSLMKKPKKSKTDKKSKTIVVIGAGLAGLGCARQLDSLFKQYAKDFYDLGEEPPKVVVLEGRNRLGGRVYSRALDSRQSQRLIGFKGRRHSVECGGMIITGFERGNPLNVLVRGQMALPYYALRSDTTLYDSNGKPVDEARDRLVEKLYNDCLERVSDYKFKNPPSKLIEGNRDLINEGRDSSSEGHKAIARVEEATAALPQALPIAEQSLGPRVSLVPVSTDRATGKTHAEPGTSTTLRAAYKAKLMGWTLREGIDEDHDLDLDAAAKASNATLGSVMDEAITQYKNIVDLTAQDFRLINWHVANLEYSNAINYNQLSLSGWDIDAGNEWEGKHTMVVGGYQNVPWGLGNSPSRLDIRKEATVKRVSYSPEKSGAARVECENGATIDADYVVSTIPLGVLKHGDVEFAPPLPSWKTDVIGRLGYGILNKIILVYREAFWDTSRDIFGVLRTPHSRHSLEQGEYTSQRGRCFQWFDVSNMSGIPVLLGLMAGDAGFDTEHTENDELVGEATQVLRSIYGGKVPQQPLHCIVTRWGSDKFARGSYSSAGPDMKPNDYQTMARPVGNLFFAGEHTIETHPATVHGAYLSGLRAASEVLEAMLGAIQIPTPLIVPKDSLGSSAQGLKRKGDMAASPPSPRSAKQARIDAYELEAWNYIVSKIGERPWKPQKVAGNAYILFSKAHYETARRRCEEGRRSGKGRPGPNDVRIVTSKMWKEASAEERKPFEDQAAELKRGYSEKLQKWEQDAKAWDEKYVEIRREWEKEHTLVLDDIADECTGRERRRAGRVGTYAESEGSEIDLDG